MYPVSASFQGNTIQCLTESSVIGTWFFPSDTMNPNESVLDCVCRVLVEQTGMTVDSKRASYWGDVVILDNMPTQPMLFLEDKYKDSKQPAEEEDATLTVFVYCNCATTDPKAKVERDKHGNDVPAVSKF